jgi:parallel beta-helix repeat protein
MKPFKNDLEGPMNHYRFALLWTGILMAATLAAVCLVASPPAMARAPQAATLTVCPAGPPDCDYSSIQAAVDGAEPGDVVKVATGLYTDVHTRPVPLGYPNPPASGVITQVVYLTKAITIRGGYVAPGFGEPSDPDANPTTLDAQGLGRGLFITGTITPTIEGVVIHNGDATELGGDDFRNAGGGIYSVHASPVISNCIVRYGAAYFGAGIYAADGQATIVNNLIDTNENNGIYLMRSNALVSGNTVQGNVAYLSGGGLRVAYGSPTIRENTIQDNIAYGSVPPGPSGGAGLRLFNTVGAIVADNLIQNNNAAEVGGGIYLFQGTDAQITGNTIQSNETSGDGGGFFVYQNDGARIEDNIIKGNVADFGGGLSLQSSTRPRIARNLIVDSPDGGGIYAASTTDITLENNVIAHNRSFHISGYGLLMSGGSAIALHNTFFDNDHVGINAYNSAKVVVTNTVVTSHEIGLTASGISSQITADTTLWWNNATMTAGNVITNNDQIGDPAFVNPATDDYHLAAGSAALDAGVDAGLLDDIDGEFRPRGCFPDIGADEAPLYPISSLSITHAISDTRFMTVTLAWSPPAAAFTYTLRISTSAITDGNWASATLLADALPGSATAYTATLPRSENTLFFALRWYACGDESPTSNNVHLSQRYPPLWHIYLPVISKGL